MQKGKEISLMSVHPTFHQFFCPFIHQSFSPSVRPSILPSRFLATSLTMTSGLSDLQDIPEESECGGEPS